MKIFDLTTIAICAGAHTAMAFRPNSASLLSQKTHDYTGIIQDARQASFSKRSISDSAVVSQQGLYRRADLIRRSGRGEGNTGHGNPGSAPSPEVQAEAGVHRLPATGQDPGPPAVPSVNMERSGSGTLRIEGDPVELPELPPGAKLESGPNGALTTIHPQPQTRVKLQQIPGTDQWQTPEGKRVHLPKSNRWDKLKDSVAPPKIQRTNSGRVEQHNTAPSWLKPTRQCLVAGCLTFLGANQWHATATAAGTAGKLWNGFGAAGLTGLTSTEAAPLAVKTVDAGNRRLKNGPSKPKAGDTGKGWFKKLRGGTKKPAHQGPR